MLDVTPPQGGSLNIVPGVHSYDRFAAVTLVATPKPGYQFVYWMGNVTDAATGTTMVFLDSPKMVIAVFERNKFETTEDDGLESTSGGGDNGGGLVRSLSESYSSSDISSDASYSSSSSGHSSSSDESSDIPVPVPEPVSAALFFAGAFMLARSRRNGANITDKT